MEYSQKKRIQKKIIFTRKDSLRFIFQPSFQKFMQLDKRKFYSACVFIHGSDFEQIRNLSGRNILTLP